MYEHDHHSHDRQSGRKLTLALAITLGFAGVEAVAGWWADSLALLSDAIHMLTDSSALGLAILAAWFARQPADAGHTWGHGRAEVLAGMTNAMIMLVIVAGIVYGAIHRLQNPPMVKGGIVVLVAAIGLGVNLLVLYTLTRGHQNLNVRGAVLHVMGDTLGSLAALGSGVVILLTGWMPIDPILSLLICALIVVSAVRLLRDALNVVMEGVPRHLQIADIGRTMAGVPGVASVHDLHVWQVHSDRIALSAHVVLRDMTAWLRVLAALRTELQKQYGIEHVTLQPEPLPETPLPDPRRS